MKRLMPSFVLTMAILPACGGSAPPPEEPISVNPPGPDGEPGIGDGAGPPTDPEAPINANPPGPDGEPGIGDGALPPDVE